jgi:hypothetical protein
LTALVDAPDVSDPTTEANFRTATLCRDVDQFEAKP